ncbi:MAG: peptidylprolyl isomerase [bacterium]
MPMLSKLREQTKFWMWIVGGAFLLTIVFAWGMDFSGGGVTQVLGKVNGEKIMVQEYQRALQSNYQYQQQQMGGREIDSSMMEYLEEQTWQQIVNQTLIRQEIERLGLHATEEEVRETLLTNPPAIVRDIPDFQTDGSFDRQKYLAATRNQNFAGMWVELEQIAAQAIPEKKLEHMILGTVTVTDDEARESYRYRNERVDTRYTVLRPELVPDSTLTVSDEEVRSYYDDHRSEFEEPEKVDFNYVLLYKDPSPRDRTERRETIQELRERLQEGEDFARLARQYSDDTTAQEGGSLGWINRGDMVAPFEEAAFSLPAGRVSEPVTTQFGTHLVKVDSVRAREGSEQRKVRHILLEDAPSSATLDSLGQTLDDLRRQAAMEDFTTAATRLGLTVDQTGPVARDGFLPGIGYEPDVTTWGFENEVGDVSEVLEHTSAYFVVQVRDKIEAGVPSLEEVREQIVTELKTREAMQRLGERARQLADRMKQRPDRFRQIAEEEGLEVQETGTFTRNDFVNGIGRDPRYIAAAFDTPVSGVAGPIESDDAWYILKVIDHTEPASDQLRSVIESEKQRLLQSRRQNAFNQWLMELRDRADIVDNRSKVLR